MLRDWQSKNLKGYLSRFNAKKVEVTNVYQGAGKTLYSAVCYLNSLIPTNYLGDLPMDEIKKRSYNILLNREKNFAVVVVPSKCILINTIRVWMDLGITIKAVENRQLAVLDFNKLQQNNIHGVILTYSQLINNGYQVDKIWHKNFLIRFIEKYEIKAHLILDEAHKLSIKKMFSGLNLANLTAQFFISNKDVFTKIHLLSGTFVKSRYEKEKSRIESLRVAFLNYDIEGNIQPDTLYTQQQAIQDKAIVPTEILLYPLDNCHYQVYNIETKNTEFFTLTDEELTWFGKNSNSDKSKEIAKEINNKFRLITSSDVFWKNLLCLGDKWLNTQKKKLSTTIGIIFCPSIDVAVMVHKLLINRSVLVTGSNKKEEGCTQTDSKNIKLFLQNYHGQIDYVISCMALNEGFDFPECKLSILIPSLNFLNKIRISQSLGRINRTIPGLENMEALSITVNYLPITELIKQEQKELYGLVKPLTHTHFLLEENNIDVINTALDKAKFNAGTKEKPTIKFITTVLNLVFGNAIKTNNKYMNNKEVFIRSTYLNWDDLVQNNQDMNPELKKPPTMAGCYVMINAKTLQILYVGKASNLHDRICNVKRYRETKWIKDEGANNIFVHWTKTEDYDTYEVELKSILKPKYDGEKHRRFN